MTVGELPPERAPDAVALWHEVGLTRPWNDPAADLQRALAHPTATVLAALDGLRLVGTVMVGHDGHRGWVYYLAVDPARQRAGVGRALMSAAEDWLRARGVPKLNLMVRHSNSAVTAFYTALGYGDDEVVVLSKRL